MTDAHNSWLKSALGVDVGHTLKRIENAGSSAVKQVAAADQAVTRAKSAAWEGTKTAYGAVTGAYDAVAPDLTKSNQVLGKVVDAGEAAAKKGNNKAAAKYGNVPVVGNLVKGATLVGNTTTDALGGVVKGVGDLASMSGNAIIHPIDSAESMAEGALGIAEHGPMAPGVNTTVKGAHGLFDIARGKKDGEYGGNLKDLGKNLAFGTHQDPNEPKDPNKRTNADLDFAAGLGGGTKAWIEKPAEAAMRTLVNLAPMVLGADELAGKKAPPKGGSPVPKVPSAPVVGYADVDPFTADIARNNPDLVRQPTNRTPARTDKTVFMGESVPPIQGPSELDQIRTKVPDQRGGGAEFSKKRARSKP